MALVPAAVQQDELDIDEATSDDIPKPPGVSLSPSSLKRNRDEDELGSSKRRRTCQQHQSTLHRELASARDCDNSEPSLEFEKHHFADNQSCADSRVAYWVKERFWPKEDEMDRLDRVRARPRSVSRKRSEPGGSTPSIAASEPKTRDEKSAPYRDVRYEFNLEKAGVFMRDSEQGITEKSRALCKRLLEETQAPPSDSLFRADIFDETCRDLHTRNEARVLRDIGMLLVPSAETLRKMGDRTLGSLIESVNETWSNCRPLDSSQLTPARPQPDYSLGFRREAFTEDQLQRLEPLIGNAFAESYFAATYRMYFPFYTSEVKCGREGLDVADRQNAHSMAIAVRAIVALFKTVGREKELDGEILTFSVSHDNESVRIYGWYPAIGAKITTHRRTIRKFNFTELDGRDKWATDTFTKNVYRIYMPELLKFIRSAIDELPPNVSAWARPEAAGLEHSGLSQQLEGQSISEGDGLEQETPESSRVSTKRTKPTQGSLTDATESERGAERGPRKV